MYQAVKRQHLRIKIGEQASTRIIVSGTSTVLNFQEALSVDEIVLVGGGGGEGMVEINHKRNLAFYSFTVRLFRTSIGFFLCCSFKKDGKGMYPSWQNLEKLFLGYC